MLRFGTKTLIGRVRWIDALKSSDKLNTKEPNDRSSYLSCHSENSFRHLKL